MNDNEDDQFEFDDKGQQIASARDGDKGSGSLDSLQLDLKNAKAGKPQSKLNNFVDDNDKAPTERGQKLDEDEFKKQKENAEANISDFNFEFRKLDPQHRFRVQAIIEKTVAEAKKNILRKSFSKHLANSKLDNSKVQDSNVEYKKNRESVRNAFYETRDKAIEEQTHFSTAIEKAHQAKNHFQFESNKVLVSAGWLPIIEELDKNKQKWDLVILILAIFNSFAVPLEYVITELENNPSYQYLDLIINILFIFDIIIGFRTTYFDSQGMEIRSPKQLAMNYLKGMFVVDFLSSIPYRYVKIIIPAIDAISFCKILKIARISRFGPFVQRLELNEEDKATLKILQLLITLVLILHCLGCLWFTIVVHESIWAPPLDFIYVQRNEYNRFYDMEQVTQTYQFLVVLYLGVLALGGNEMGPRTSTEIAVMFFLLVTLILVNAYVFGTMSGLVAEAQKKPSTLQKEVDLANTSMHNLELQNDTKTEIRMFLISTQGTQYEQNIQQQFMDLISPSFQEQVSIEIFVEVALNNLQIRTAIMQIAKQYIIDHPFPKTTLLLAEQNLLKPIVKQIKIQFNKPDDVLIEKLKQGEFLFLIAKGECVVDFRHGNLNTQETSQNLRKAERMCGQEQSGKGSKELKQKNLRYGQLFGEISLIYNCVTTASVIALKYSTIGKLPKEDFLAVCHKHKPIKKCITEGIFLYSDKDMQFIKMALRQLPFLSHLLDTDTILYDVIYKMTTQEQKKGDFKTVGDPIDEIFIIEHGIAELYIPINGRDIVLERLFRGSVINYKNVFHNTEKDSTNKVTYQVNLRFATESIIKILHIDDIIELRERKNQKVLSKSIKKFMIKVQKIKAHPLDYILALPKGVYREFIKRTREKLLFSKQDQLMEELDEQKRDFKKYQGLEMDDPQQAAALHKIQKNAVKDLEVIQSYTRMNHLELRVKNIAVAKLIEGQKGSDKKAALTKVILEATSNKGPKMKRQDTSSLNDDGLVERLQEQITKTSEKIATQSKSLDKIKSSIDLMMPSSGMRYGENDNDFQDNGKIRLNK